MSTPAIDVQLRKIVSEPPPSTIGDVIALMQQIDEILPNGDGLKWFNLLYLKVTQQVDSSPPPGGWKDANWLTRLDIVFAQFYFSAILNWLNDSAGVPSSWKALFEGRSRPDVERIQFALAGMNAHINHDLALALLSVEADLNIVPNIASPEHDDYEHVNKLLEVVLPAGLQFLATGILGELAEDSGKIGQLLAIWNVSAARDLAWDFADHLRSLPDVARPIALKMQDQLTGVIGRSLLLPA